MAHNRTGRECVACGADIVGNDPHEDGCGRAFDPDTLHDDGAADYRRRVENGEATLARTWASATPVQGMDDREAAASDAISNILTAVYGPAGVTRQVGEKWIPCADAENIRRALALLSRAERSYEGDAEDYSAITD